MDYYFTFHLSTLILMGVGCLVGGMILVAH